MAAAFARSCEDANTEGVWWLKGQIPVLMAQTLDHVEDCSSVFWNYNDHAIVGDFAMPTSVARAWKCGNAGVIRHCLCGLPGRCPLDCYLRGALEDFLFAPDHVYP